MKNESLKPRLVKVDNMLLDYLAPDSGKTHTRLGAYHSLLAHACAYNASVNRLGQTFELDPGQFVVTITELAKEWKWSRGAVRRFIDQLCALGQLEVNSFVKCAVVDVVSLRFKWDDGNHPFKAINAYTEFADAISLADQSPETHFICPPIPDLSGIDIVSPYRDESGEEVYNLSQRRAAAYASQGLVTALAKSAMPHLYTPKVEKSMLDVYHQICGSDPLRFKALVEDLFTSREHQVFHVGHELFADVILRVEKFLSLASSLLAEHIPDVIVASDHKGRDNASNIASDEAGGEL